MSILAFLGRGISGKISLVFGISWYEFTLQMLILIWNKGGILLSLISVIVWCSPIHVGLLLLLRWILIHMKRVIFRLRWGKVWGSKAWEILLSLIVGYILVWTDFCRIYSARHKIFLLRVFRQDIVLSFILVVRLYSKAPWFCRSSSSFVLNHLDFLPCILYVQA